MDFDRIYNSRREPAHLDDFTDSNVQALIEGRRKRALPRPNLNVIDGHSSHSPNLAVLAEFNRTWNRAWRDGDL